VTMCFRCRPFPDCDLMLSLTRPSEEEMELVILKPRGTPARVRRSEDSDGAEVIDINVAAERAANHLTFKFDISTLQNDDGSPRDT